MGREDSLERRERQDQEKADARRARQERLGHVPANAPMEAEESPPKPKRKPRAKSGSKK